MKKKLVKIGRLGRAHGLQGELKLRIEDTYLEDLPAIEHLLVAVSGQYIPYFVDYWRSDGAIVKLEEVDNKEAATLLQQKDLYLPADQLTIPPTTTGPEGTPYDHWQGWCIIDDTVGTIGNIQGIIDLPQHYLAEVVYQDKLVMIPLHEDLINSSDEQAQTISMNLPAGLLDL